MSGCRRCGGRLWAGQLTEHTEGLYDICKITIMCDDSQEVMQLCTHQGRRREVRRSTVVARLGKRLVRVELTERADGRDFKLWFRRGRTMGQRNCLHKQMCSRSNNCKLFRSVLIECYDADLHAERTGCYRYENLLLSGQKQMPYYAPITPITSPSVFCE